MMTWRRGFTLIEILVVCAILAILIALSVPAYARSKDRAQVANCTSNLHQIGVATQLYQADYDGSLPNVNFNAYRVVGEDGWPRAAPHPLRSYGMTEGVGHCARSYLKGKADYPTMVDYMCRFQFDFSSTNGLRELWKQNRPAPTSAIVWDWNHLYSNNLTAPNEHWLVLRADGSVSSIAAGSVRKSYWTGTSWTFEVPSDPNSFYQFVFPEEEWPPTLDEPVG